MDYSDSSRMGAFIWLHHLLRYCLMCVVPSLYSVGFCIRVACVCLICLLLCKDEGSSLVSL